MTALVCLMACRSVCQITSNIIDNDDNRKMNSLFNFGGDLDSNFSKGSFIVVRKGPFSVHLPD